MTAGGPAAGIAASLSAIGCLLPWLTVDLGAIGDSISIAPNGAPEIRMPGMEEMFSSMMSSMNLSGSVTVRGIDGWVGIVALLASIAVAVLTFVEPLGALPWRRRSVLLANVGCSLAAAGLVLYALSDVGGAVSIEYGLAIAVLGAGAAAVLAIRRLRPTVH